MATDEDRSLNSGLSFPVWMKTRSRLHDRLDFDQSTFSPPENDDSFLYIRYPKQESNVIRDNNIITVTDSNIKTATTAATTTAIKVLPTNLAKHTAPCQDYILGNKEPSQSQIVITNGKTKPAGTDDGFKGEAAACGTSVIKVASQMISSGNNSNKVVVKGFDTFEDEEKEHMRTIGFDPKLRRGSRSLPASPLQSPSASPKSKRKIINKYFTGAGAYTDDKKPGSILANILALRDSNLSRSVTSIAEEQSTTSSTSSSSSTITDGVVHKMQNLTTTFDEKKTTPTTQKPKPSHLREMNFWSPTSM